MAKSFKEQVIGTWQLVEYSTINEAGEKEYPLGKAATGYLMYTADGYLSAQLMSDQERPAYDEDQGDLHTGTTEQMARAAHGYHAYSGKYEVDEATQTLYHHMEVSLIPNRLGQVQDRKVQLEGQQITITSSVTAHTIIWQKAVDHSDNSRDSL